MRPPFLKPNLAPPHGLRHGLKTAWNEEVNEIVCVNSKCRIAGWQSGVLARPFSAAADANATSNSDIFPTWPRKNAPRQCKGCADWPTAGSMSTAHRFAAAYSSLSISARRLSSASSAGKRKRRLPPLSSEWHSVLPTAAARCRADCAFWFWTLPASGPAPRSDIFHETVMQCCGRSSWRSRWRSAWRR